MLLLLMFIVLSLGEICTSVECPPAGYNQLVSSGSVGDNPVGNICRRQVVNPNNPTEMIIETEVAPDISYWACPKGCHMTEAGCDTGAERKMCIAGHKKCDDADAYFSLDGGYVSPYCSKSKDACYKCSQRTGKYCVDGKEVPFDDRGDNVYFSSAKNFPCLGRDILGSCNEPRMEQGCGQCSGGSSSLKTCTLCRNGLKDGMCQFKSGVQKDVINVCVSDCNEWWMYTEEVCETVKVDLRGAHKKVFIRRPNARYQGTWATNGFRNWKASGVPGEYTEDGYETEYRPNLVATDEQRRLDRFLPSVCSYFTYREEDDEPHSLSASLNSKVIFREGNTCGSNSGWDKFRNLKCASGQNPAGHNHCNGCDQCLLQEYGTTVPPVVTTPEVTEQATTTTTETVGPQCNYVCVLERRVKKCFDCDCPADYPDRIPGNPLTNEGNYCVKQGAGAQDVATGDWRCPGNCDLTVGLTDSKEYRCILRMGVTPTNQASDGSCPRAETFVANSEEEETSMYLLGFIWANTVLFTYGMSSYQNRRKGDVYRNLLEDTE